MNRCARLWEAEALLDGRLSASDRASFERHATGCAACTDELAALDALVDRLAVVDAPERSDLERRSDRTALLRRANEALTKERPRRTVAFALVAATVVAIALFAWLGRGPRGPRTFEVVDVTRAVFEVESEGDVSAVRLRDGTALFQVGKRASGQRFLVRLPDGEIEVRGTRFVVDVRDGRTQSVVVTEGVVALRIGNGESILHAGDRWPQAAAAATSATGPTDDRAVASGDVPRPTDGRPVVPPVRGPIASTDGPPRASGEPTAPTASAAEALPSAAPPASAADLAPPSPASQRFAEAMRAFSSGDFAKADAAFAAFTREFPRDGRAEDALFLRIQSKARLGDRAGASVLAEGYLRAFPRGLRRPEVERFVIPR